MPKIAYSKSLDDYFQLPIKELKNRGIVNIDTSIVYIPYKREGEEYKQAVKINKTPCNYGGFRYWFICPKCNNRVAKLYRNGIFVCRKCIGVNYKCQLKQPRDREFKRLNALRDRLGWEGGIVNGIGSKPKGMHLKTYIRLLVEYIKLEDICNGHISAHLGMIDRRFDKIATDIKRTKVYFGVKH